MSEVPTAPEAFPPTLAEAIVRAFAELENLTRDREARIPGKDNKPGYSYRYSDLASFTDETRPILAKYGLALLQDVGGDGKVVTLTTTILHASGESRTTPELVSPAGGTPQATGSAITYARRYQGMAALGLAAEDDDGQTAARTPYQEAAPPPEEDPAGYTITRTFAEAYVERAEAAGLTPDQIQAITYGVTKHRTSQPALVLQSEWDELNARTREAVQVRRNTGPQAPGSPPAPETGSDATETPETPVSTPQAPQAAAPDPVEGSPDDSEPAWTPRAPVEDPELGDTATPKGDLSVHQPVVDRIWAEVESLTGGQCKAELGRLKVGYASSDNVATLRAKVSRERVLAATGVDLFNL